MGEMGISLSQSPTLANWAFRHPIDEDQKGGQSNTLHDEEDKMCREAHHLQNLLKVVPLHFIIPLAHVKLD